MSTQIVYSGKSAVGHWSQLLTLGTSPPTKPVQTLPLPSPERSQSQPSGQLGVHIGAQNGTVPCGPCTHTSPSGQLGVHIGSPPWHSPPTHSCPEGQRLKHSPQWRSFLCRLTHLSPQRVWRAGQPQTLSSPRLTQFLEQHWESLRHSRPNRLQSLAQATPGTKANAAPRRAPPIHLMALPLERVPVASPFASSSKEVNMEEPPDRRLAEEE
jgi:hypothetical protein